MSYSDPGGWILPKGEVRLTYNTASVTPRMEMDTLQKFIREADADLRRKADADLRRKAKVASESVKAAKAVQARRIRRVRSRGIGQDEMRHGWGENQGWDVPVPWDATCICGHVVSDHTITTTEISTLTRLEPELYVTNVVCAIDECGDEYDDPWKL